MGNALHGKSGSVTWSGYKAHVHKWTMERDIDLVDSSEFGMVNKTRLAGLKDAKGTFTCYVDDTTPLSDAGTTGALTLIMTTGRQFSMPAVYIRTVSVTTDVMQNIEATFSFELAGDGTANAFVVA